MIKLTCAKTGSPIWIDESRIMFMTKESEPGTLQESTNIILSGMNGPELHISATQTPERILDLMQYGL